MWMKRSANRRPASWVLRYGVVVAAVAVALLLTLSLGNPNILSTLFFPAVLVGAWYGGLWAGLVGAGLSYLAIHYFLLRPTDSVVALNVDDAAYLVVFAISASFVAWLTSTQRRAAADLLRQASLLDLTHDTVFVRDQDDVITYWNHGAAELYGWSKEEAIGRASHELLRTIFPVPLAEIEATLVRTGRWEGEIVHTKRDETPVVVGSRWSLQRDDEGRPAGVLETNNDVTTRKAAEEAQRQSEEQWRDVFENNPTMYFMVDSAGTIMAVNPYGAEQLGYDVDELVGQPVLNVFPDADRKAVQENVALCLGHLGRPISWEARKVRKDGTVIMVRETAKAVPRASGPIVLVVCEDITEQKRAGEALRQAHAELAHVTRVTMLGEITASIAHEVNQPLAAVVMNGNACLRWLATDPPNLVEAREAAQRIVSDGNRAGQVIARVRKLLKREISERSSLDVNELIAETLAFTRTDVARHDVSTRTELRESLPAVMGDRVQLQQVLVNLILNATDAMSEVNERRRVLTIRSRREDAGRVLVEVQDCGTGLAPGESDRIFDAFFSTKPGGLGMGLSVSRSIVELHGGRISAAPNEGPGVTVKVSLPAASAPG